MNPASPQPVRVLIAEDNLISRMVVAKMAETLGCLCTEVENGQEAVDRCREPGNEYDLVLLDIEMPVMDGLDAAKLMQAHFEAGGLSRPRIVALTGETFEANLERYRQTGFDACLGKPLKIEQLKALVASVKESKHV